jgi:hypothetical protein
MEKRLGDRWHAPLWLGGIAVALLPFLIATFFDGPRAPWVDGPGNLGINLIKAVWWGLGGAFVGGLLWLKFSGRTMVGSFRRWLSEKHHFHWFWYLLSVGLFGLHSYYSLEGYQFTTLEKMSTVLGRILTGAIVVGICWLACGLAGGVAPKKMCRWPWAVAAVLPFVFLTDLTVIRFWKNSTISLLNQLDEGGRIELQVNLASGGIPVPSWAVLAGIAGLIWGFHRTFHWLGQKNWASGFHMPRWTAASSVVLLWGGVWAEKAAGTGWKSQNARRWEQNAYDLHLTRGLEPPLGVACFQVRFSPGSYGHGAARPGVTGDRPDIFILMMESLRQDAIQPAHAPFLSRFRDEECQQLGKTWASSNSTPLSWYGLFNGVLPISWPGARAKLAETKSFETPPFLQMLSGEDYRMEVHVVCDLSYRSLGPLSFGTDQSRFEALVDAPIGETSWGTYHEEIPQRERAAFETVLASVSSNPAGGNFHFIALDSTHYSYQWPEDFELPYRDYYDSSTVPAFPDEEQIDLIKKRYYNSLAWVDLQIGEFVSALKSQGRYHNSLIIVTGDHGEEFYENGSWFHSSSLLPAQTQVPLLIKWPEEVDAPDHPSASHLDLVPSLSHYLGVPLEANHPGTSLLDPPLEERTQISFACNTGVSGVCMAWYRDDWVATFRWENPFSHDLPRQIYLDSVFGPDGERMALEEPDEWENLLFERFPDAPNRLFSEFGLIVEEE